MNALNLPLTTPASAATERADCSSSPPAEEATQDFARVMGDALTANGPAENQTAPAESSVEDDAPGSTNQKPTANEPATPLSIEMLTAMIFQTTPPSPGASPVPSGSPAGGTNAAAGESIVSGVSLEATPASQMLTALGSKAAQAGSETTTVQTGASSNTTVTTQAPAKQVELPEKTAAPLSASSETPVSEVVKPSVDNSPSKALALSANQAEVAEQKLPDAPITSPDPASVSSNLEIAAQISAPASASESNSSRGTSGAKYPLPMQKAEKMNDLAGSTEQKLPVMAIAAGTEALPAKAVRSLAIDSDSDKAIAFPAIGSSPTDSNIAPEVKTHFDSTAIANPVRTLERTQDLMALHAFRLRDSGNDSMQVVIKPSPDLHIALNLEMRNGTMEVNARLQRGDYEFLNSHWNDLQQQMEARGVRLAPLSNQNTPLSSNGNSSQQSGRQPAEEKAAKSGAFAEFALAGALIPKRTNKNATARGWESWA